jgi:radical S-adenosyl methionine domain-containing protein 2
MLYIPELTINWHVLEACNYSCYFCYAKYGQKPKFSSHYHSILREISTLKGRRLDFQSGSIDVGSVRINFAGGEPLLAKELGPAIKLAAELGLRPSLITNGSLLTDTFIKEYGPMVSVFGLSVDSFDVEINNKIGRKNNNGEQISFNQIKRIFSLLRAVSKETKIKLNTVVSQENVESDFTDQINCLRPDRWKVLRVIPIHGAENRGISDNKFNGFLERHKHVECQIIPENNDHMHRSYLMLDPSGRFYQREESDYVRSKGILEAGATSALKSVQFDAHTFLSRYQ